MTSTSDARNALDDALDQLLQDAPAMPLLNTQGGIDTDIDDISWLLPLFDNDNDSTVDDSKHSAASAASAASDTSTSSSATPSPRTHTEQLADSTCKALLHENLLRTHILASDDSDSSYSSSRSASSQWRSTDRLDTDDTHTQATRKAAVRLSLASNSPPKRVLTSTHARRKHEKQVLTLEVQALETALQQLKASSQSRLHRPTSTSVVPSTSESPLQQTPSKRIATRERELLQRSKRRNAQLRLRLHDHKLLSKRLQRLLLERAANATLLGEQLFRPGTGSAELTLVDVERLRTMIHDLDTMRNAAAVTLPALVREAPARGAFRNWHAHFDATTAVQLRVVTCEELPFSEAQVARALQRYRQHKGSSFRVYDSTHFGGTSDVLVAEERSDAFAPLCSRGYRHRRVSRKFQHGGLDVTLSVSHIDSVDANGLATPDFAFALQSWIIGTCHFDGVCPRTGLQLHSTSVQNCTTITPLVARDVHSLCDGASLVERVLMPLWDREVAARLRQVENMLMDMHL